MMANSCLHTYWQKNKVFLFSLSCNNFPSQPCPKHLPVYYLLQLSRVTALENLQLERHSVPPTSDKQVDLKTKAVIDFSFSWGSFSLNCTLCINSTFSYQLETSVTEAFTLNPLHFKSSS